MIGLAEERDSDYQHIERRIAGLSTLKQVEAFYEGFIERYAALNDSFQFSECFDPQYIWAQLQHAWRIRHRSLFAMPFGIKDIFNTRVLPTAMGSDIWKGFHPGNNARVVDEIADQGGIIFSKTTTAEFAVHYIQHGRTINPHNENHITGTSSAGSAVAVACGALPIALGTQTAGSIVRPASFCGVFGFKPSFGAYDRTGTLKTCDTLDTIGLLGSDIAGLGKTFLASFQKDPQYPLSKRFFEKLKAFHQKRQLKIAIVADQFSGYADYDAVVKQDFEAACDLLAEQGFEIESMKDIDYINDIHELHQNIYCKSLSYYFKEEQKHGSGISKIMLDMIELGTKVSVDAYVSSLKKQPQYRARFDSQLAKFDFLVTPSTASVAPAIGGSEKPDTCLIWTFFGYPVISVPAFRDSDSGLPFGLQIVAPKFSDLPLLEFGQRMIEILRRKGRD